MVSRALLFATVALGLMVLVSMVMKMEQSKATEMASALENLEDFRRQSKTATLAPTQPIIIKHAAEMDKLTEVLVKNHIIPSTPSPAIVIITPPPTHGLTLKPTPFPTYYSGTTVHFAFEKQVRKLANRASEPRQRVVLFHKVYHYYSGREQMKRYFKERNWNLTFYRYPNNTEGDDLPMFPHADLILTPCTSANLSTLIITNSTNVLVSANENDYAMKRTFAEAMNTEAAACGGEQHGNSWMLNTINQCSETTGRNFFVKLKHGSGTFAKPGLMACDLAMKRSSTSFVFAHARDGVQGRSFLLVSSYNPITVWFHMAYLDKQHDLFSIHNHMFNLHASTRKNIKMATFASLVAILPQLNRAARSERQQQQRTFSLFNIDFVVFPNGEVRVLELGCNAGILNNPKQFGTQLVGEATKQVDGMMDLVIATHFHAEEFRPMFAEYRKAEAAGIQSDRESFSERYPAWELVYFEGSEEEEGFMFRDSACNAIEEAQVSEEEIE